MNRTSIITGCALAAGVLALASTAHANCAADPSCFDVSTYYTAGDPNHDIAVQDALYDAGLFAGHATLYFPTGDYDVTQPLNVGRAVKGGLSIVGAAGPTRPNLRAQADVPLITTGVWVTAAAGDALVIEGMALVADRNSAQDVVYVGARPAGPAYVADVGQLPSDLADCAVHATDANLQRLVVEIRDSTITNSQGRGLHLGGRVDATLDDVDIDTVAYGLAAQGIYLSGRRTVIDASGLDITGGDYGFYAANGAERACVRLADSTIQKGLFLGLGDESYVETHELSLRAPPFFASLADSRAVFRASDFVTSDAGSTGTVSTPKDVLFDDVELEAVGDTDGAALLVVWNAGSMNPPTNQHLELRDVDFTGTAQRAIWLGATTVADDNALTITRGTTGNGFQYSIDQLGGITDADGWAPGCTTTMHLDTYGPYTCAVSLVDTPYAGAGACVPVMSGRSATCTP